MSETKITFLGAARNVTGSCYMLESGNFRVLIDCGLYQERDFKERNWAPFAIPPETINAVILTHAHLDHCGLLPRLVHQGFKGPIYCTPATADIAEIVLLDSAHIQEHDVAYKKKRHEKEGKQSPHPYQPLYTVEDAEKVLPMFNTHAYLETFQPTEGITVSFHDAGHILGSSMTQIDLGTGEEKRRIIFSGDVGRWDTPLIRNPTNFEEADYIIVESTYGNRVHKDNSEIPVRLAAIINKTVKAGGNVVIPSFAVERTQELLYHLHNLIRENRIPNLPVILDSPMATKVTEVFQKHPELFDEETMKLIRNGEHPCDLPKLQISRSTDESKAINNRKDSAIIIAGSGMCTGGRIKHHIVNNIGKPASTLLFIGYQANGTLGRQLIDKHEKVRIHGEQFEVKAYVTKINGFSAHADQNELLRWLSSIKKAPRKVFVTHGETDSASAFGDFVKEKTGWPVEVPEYQQTIILE